MRASPQPQREPSLMREQQAAPASADSSSGAEPVDPPGRLDRRLGHEEHGRDRRDHDEDEREPEQPVVAERVDDRAGEHDARARRRCRGSPRSARCRCATRSRGNSSRMIPNASGKIAPPTPWMTRATISTPMIVRERGEQRADAEHDERDDEHALLAEHVAEAADDRRQDRGAEQVRRQHPGRPPSAEACSSRWISGSAGATSDCSSANVTAAERERRRTSGRSAGGARAAGVVMSALDDISRDKA